jgi:hypothetical protein
MDFAAFSRCFVISCLTFFVAAPSFAASSKKRGFIYRVTPVPHREVLKRWEFRTAPIALLARWYTLDVSWRFSKHWSTGPAVVFYRSATIGNMLTPSFRGSAVGWQGNYYFQSVERNSWYAGFHSYYEEYDSYLEGRSGRDAVKGLRLDSALGYQWRGAGSFRPLHFMAGVGPEYKDRQRKRFRELEGGAPFEDGHQSLFGIFLEFKMGIEI